MENQFDFDSKEFLQSVGLFYQLFQIKREALLLLPFGFHLLLPLHPKKGNKGCYCNGHRSQMNTIVEREMYVKEVEGGRMMSEMEHMWKYERFSNEMSYVAKGFLFLNVIVCLAA